MSEVQVAQLNPLIVHPLPAAPAFTGREEELRQLDEFWSGGPGILSLIGLGGAGKTALAEKFVSKLMAEDPPEGLLIWSFYDDPDANHFLKTAYSYFTGGRIADAKGAGWFHLLREYLSSGKRFLIVMDGLERVQRQQTDASGIYGELEDPLLRGLLVRLASGAGNTKAIVTSRFPVANVEQWAGRGYTVVDVDQLDKPSAYALLRSHGVTGSEEQFDTILRQYGRHALTLDLLSGAIGRFYEGDTSRLPEFTPDLEDKNLQGARLASVLQLYERHLPEREMDLLSRLCVFRFGVDVSALESIFLGDGKGAVSGALATLSPSDLDRDLDELAKRHLVYRETKGKFSVHPAVRDHFYRLFRDPTVLHDAVREHFTSLSARPGIGLPTDKDSLDMLEELVYHAIQAGSVKEAADIYLGRLGGNDHLNTKLGEYVRTHRILSAFAVCPDKSAMYHCMRAFGRFEEALQWRPKNRYILLLSGKLSLLTQDESESTRTLARILQGANLPVPLRSPDVPLPASWIHLYKKDTAEARRTAEAETAVSLYQDDVARNKLVLAEVERVERRLEKSKELLEECSPWILTSGSQEHLALLHLVRARIALDSGQTEGAAVAIEEGLCTARECDFGLLLIHFLIERARLNVALNRKGAAHDDANLALELSRDPDCRFVFGEADAMELLKRV